MKCFLKWISLTMLVGSLASCGLPGAAMRTGSNLLKTVTNIIPSVTGKASATGGA